MGGCAGGGAMMAGWQWETVRRHETPARRVYISPGLALGVGVLAMVLAGAFFSEAALARAFCPTTAAEVTGRILQTAGAFCLGLWWGRR